MRKTFGFLMVCCLVVLFTGCSFYTTFDSSRATSEGSGESIVASSDSREGSECSSLGATSSDSGAEVDEDQQTAVLFSNQGEMAVVSYLFDAKETTSWKISVDYRGEGKMTALFGKSSDSQTIEGVSLELVANRTSAKLLLEKVNRFKNQNGEVEVQIVADDGKAITVQSVAIEYLSTQPKVRVVYRDISVDYRYTTWYGYYSGPLYFYDYYNDCYVVYRDWWCTPCYHRWHEQVVIYHHYYPSSRYIYCEPRFVRHYERPGHRVYSYGGNQVVMRQRVERAPANSSRSVRAVETRGRSVQTATSSASAKRSEQAVEPLTSRQKNEAPRENFFNSMKKRIFSGEPTSNSAPAARRAEPRSEQAAAPQAQQVQPQQSQQQARREQSPILRAEPRQAPAAAPSPSVSDDEDKNKQQGVYSGAKVRAASPRRR